MAITITVRGDQFLRDPVFDPDNPDTLWSASVPFPEDYKILIHVSGSENQVGTDREIIWIDVEDAEGHLIGTYFPQQQMYPTSAGDDYLGFSGYRFEPTTEELPVLRNMLILNGSNSINDLDADGLQLQTGDGLFNVITLPVPCFGAEDYVMTGSGDITCVCDLQVGEQILCKDLELSRVLWVDGRKVQITEKNRPYRWNGQVYSPQHRILIDGEWHKAKHVGQAVEPMPETYEYWHILLERHLPIAVFGGFAESLLPTPRAMAGMSSRMLQDLKDAVGDFSQYPGLQYPDHKRGKKPARKVA